MLRFWLNFESTKSLQSFAKTRQYFACALNYFTASLPPHNKLVEKLHIGYYTMLSNIIIFDKKKLITISAKFFEKCCKMCERYNL